MRVLLRCDGGGTLGIGHVMRSLALAEAAVGAGHEVVVAGHFEGSFLLRALAAAPVEVVAFAAPLAASDLRPLAGLADLAGLAGRLRPDVLHVDSYDAPGIKELAASLSLEAGRGALVFSNVEDGTFGRRPADVVIDPTLGAELSDRPDDGSTWLLRGSRYAAMRQRVLDARRRVELGPDGPAAGMPVGDAARTVLVVMGGTDPVGLAPAAVGLLARTGLALDVTVIAVGENAERVRSAAGGTALSLTVVAPVDDLATLMSEADLVISAAGTSVWELCCIGLPMAVICAVSNQRIGYDRVVEAGAALGLGGPELAGPELAGPELAGPGPQARAVGLLRTALTDRRARADLRFAARTVVDGLGAWRVVRMWEQAQRLGAARLDTSEHELARPLRAREAAIDDARLLWRWRNDPGTRASSRHTDLVPWPGHLAWLESTLTREDRVLLMVEDTVGSAGQIDPVGDGQLDPVGTVRWDLGSQGEWEVSITVAPDRRGQSLARPLLRAAELALSEVVRSGVTQPSGAYVTAYLAVVHVDNAASVRLFETSGYVPDLPPDPQGFMRFRKAARVA